MVDYGDSPTPSRVIECMLPVTIQQEYWWSLTPVSTSNGWISAQLGCLLITWIVDESGFYNIEVPEVELDAGAIMADETSEVLSRNEAIDVITDVEHFTEADAEDALARLESRGYIYFVDGQVRIMSIDEWSAHWEFALHGRQDVLNAGLDSNPVCLPTIL